MSGKNNFGIIASSKAFKKICVFLEFLADYTEDYFSGQKYKHMSELNNFKQNQK